MNYVITNNLNGMYLKENLMWTKEKDNAMHFCLKEEAEKLVDRYSDDKIYGKYLNVQ